MEKGVEPVLDELRQRRAALRLGLREEGLEVFLDPLIEYRVFGAARAASAARPSARFRSSTTLRLLRLLARKSAPMPSERRAPIERVTSPSGASILMTSAPMSPKYCAAIGPKMNEVRSRILNPSSGPAALMIASFLQEPLTWCACRRGRAR